MRRRIETAIVLTIVAAAVAAALFMILIARPVNAQLVISDITAQPGDTRDVIVSFSENDAEYVAAGLDLILPDVLDPGARASCAFIPSHDDGGAFIVSRTELTSDVRLIALAFETVEGTIPVGEFARCRVSVPIDAPPGVYVIGCSDPHGATCEDAETRNCALGPIVLSCPPAVVMIEPLPTASPTATVVPVIADGGTSESLVRADADTGGAGCEIHPRPQRSPATAALFALGLLMAVMVGPRR